MLSEVRMQGEIVVFAVFEDKDTIFLEQSLFENQVRNCGQPTMKRFTDSNGIRNTPLKMSMPLVISLAA